MEDRKLEDRKTDYMLCNFFLSQINLTVKIMKNQTVCLHPVGLTK